MDYKMPDANMLNLVAVDSDCCFRIINTSLSSNFGSFSFWPLLTVIFYYQAIEVMLKNEKQLTSYPDADWSFLEPKWTQVEMRHSHLAL